MKNKLVVIFASMILPLGLVAQETAKPEVKEVKQNSVASRTGKVAYWFEVAGIATAAPGAASLLGASTTSVFAKGGTKLGSLIAVQFGLAFLANGLIVAGIASTVEYIAEGKVSLISKADVRSGTRSVLEAAEVAPESLRPQFAPIVVALNRGDQSILSAEKYSEASKASAQFLMNIDQLGQDLKKNNSATVISLDDALALVKRASETSNAPGSLESQFGIAHRMLALNEVYIKEFVETKAEGIAN